MRGIAIFTALVCLIPLCPWGGPHARAISPGRERVAVDARGDTIPVNPENRPYQLIDGYPEYRLGIGDVIEVTIVEAGERTVETARVLPDGTVSFNVLNRIPVVDLPLSGAANLLSDELSRYIRLPQLQVFVKEYASKTASVLGSINTQTVTLSGSRTGPGVYPLKGRITALDQILEAGGPAPDARLDQVRLIRGNRTYVIDLQRAIEAGDNSQNPYLEDSDVIQVPGISQADRRVAVLGEVGLAGVFNLSTQANLLEAIAASRGFTEDAAANRLRIIRPTDPVNPEVITVNAERIFKGDLSQNVGLEDGDVIVVPRDWLTDVNDLIAQLNPILAWGGLVRTEPVVSIGGYEASFPGGSEPAPVVTTGVQGTPFFQQPAAVQAQAIQQVQQNLRKPAR